MSALAAPAAPPPPPALTAAPQGRVDVGRPFVGHTFDYLLIGGGLSLIVALAVALGGRPQLSAFIQAQGTLLILFSNSAHFAASTVRLYTKRDTRRNLPFLTMGLPLVTLLLLTVAIAYPRPIGPHIWALYVTWSPYHYGAQAYGLALMYCYRSGGQWSDSEKRWVRLACLCPFLWVFVGAKGVGLEWLVPSDRLDTAAVHAARNALGSVLAAATFLLPLALLCWRRIAGRSPLPLISALILWSNGVWLISLAMAGAFVWATIFHGIQYLAIVSVFHVRERVREAGNRRPAWQHAAGFYLACLGLGYLLFQVWPLSYTLFGFGFAESMLLVVAAINLHHFIVDAYIWRLRRDPNYATLEAASPS